MSCENANEAFYEINALCSLTDEEVFILHKIHPLLISAGYNYGKPSYQKPFRAKKMDILELKFKYGIKNIDEELVI